MNDITLRRESSFDYQQLNPDVAAELQDKEKTMATIVGNTYTELGKELLEAQELLSNHHKGVFTEWFEGLGIKKQTAYNMINRYKLVVQNLDNRETIEELPLSLAYEVSKPSASEEAKQKVLDGDITSLKEYKQLEKSLKQAEEEAEQARRSEEIALRRLEEAESKEPEVVVREIVKESVPESIKQQLVDKDKNIQMYKTSHEDMKQRLKAYETRDTSRFDENESERELKKIQFEAEKGTLEMKIYVDRFLENAAVTVFRKGALAQTDDRTKAKLKESISSLKDFIREVEMALNGRIKN